MIINGDLYLKETNVESLGELTNVNGRLSLWNCKNLKDLGKLKTVNGLLDLRFCPELITLGNLEYCRNIRLFGCENLKDLGKLKIIEIEELNSILTRLSEMPKSILGILNSENYSDMFFRPQILNSLGNLEEVDCDINISNYNFTGTIKSLNPIKKIGGTLKIGSRGVSMNSSNPFPKFFNDISSIEYIQGDLDLYYYPNDILKINPSLQLGGDILVNAYTNENVIKQIPKHLRNKITDLFEKNKPPGGYNKRQVNP
jgi:hypothetical protein